MGMAFASAKLSGGQRQAIAVARAVRQQNIKILLLEGPQAAMGAKERSLIKSLSKKSNISIIVIDHNYTHLFEICDRINVIQHGQVTVEKSLSEIKLEELIEFMVQSFLRDVDTGGGK
jgi:simple sugar transport system ATP-binding protein